MRRLAGAGAVAVVVALSASLQPPAPAAGPVAAPGPVPAAPPALIAPASAGPSCPPLLCRSATERHVSWRPRPAAPQVEQRTVVRATTPSLPRTQQQGRSRRRDEPDRTPDDWLSRRARAAKARIDYPWRSTGFRVSFRPAREGLRGMTLRRERRVFVYARRSDPVRQTACDLAHELGHAIDFAFGDRARRRQWLRLRDAQQTPWFGCDRCTDFATGAGDFAEVFALWQVGRVDFRSQVAGPPSRRGLRRLTPLFERDYHPRSRSQPREPDEVQPRRTEVLDLLP